MNLITFTWVFVGFCALCMGTKRYADRLPLSSPLKNSPGLRLSGWICLLVSVIFSITVNGAAIGITLWFGLASVAAGLVMLCLAYTPRWTPGVGALTGLVAVCGTAFTWLF
ncbi:DUF3325 domain-containing protein [Desulfosarcina sp. OttesenSCG-928-A07]|nr:DUF3325 domain-containing protein [Desulfosarcina sp. OttesenSCG-928-G17]MDL2328811.1 DUF3325 domain-containing protein [Desulfosarcina sp. OttesenSCG-928-A07]